LAFIGHRIEDCIIAISRQTHADKDRALSIKVTLLGAIIIIILNVMLNANVLPAIPHQSKGQRSAFYDAAAKDNVSS